MNVRNLIGVLGVLGGGMAAHADFSYVSQDRGVRATVRFGSTTQTSEYLAEDFGEFSREAYAFIPGSGDCTARQSSSLSARQMTFDMFCQLTTNQFTTARYQNWFDVNFDITEASTIRITGGVPPSAPITGRLQGPGMDLDLATRGQIDQTLQVVAGRYRLIGRYDEQGSSFGGGGLGVTIRIVPSPTIASFGIIVGISCVQRRSKRSKD